MPSIEVVDLFYKYSDENEDKNFVLKNFNLSINKGEFITILGHNGCGKSTLVKHFNAIYLPILGEVFIGDFNTKNESELLKIRQNVGMVFQNPDNQIVSTIVEEDVAFALENLGVDPKVIRERIDLAMNQTGIYELKDKSINSLSGGQKQRVAIAGVLAMMPSFIVLDEPTSMLDPVGRKEVIQTLLQLNKEHNITIILITHYMSEAVKSDRVIVMNKGQVVMDGSPNKVFSNVDSLLSIGLDVPYTTKFLYELNKSGYNFDLELIDEDDCVNAISNLLEDVI